MAKAETRDPTKLLDEAMREARASALSLADSLPTVVSVAAIGVMEKAPFQLLSIREPLIWRTEELARCACKALDENDLTVAATLTRSIAESVAIIWRLAELIVKPIAPDALNDDLMNIFGASRVMPDNNRRYQILKFVDMLDKHVSGTRAKYDDLSEIAHPNWQGLAGMYSKLNKKDHEVYFGRDEATYIFRKTQIAILLSTFLNLFEIKYKKISETLPEWIARMTPMGPSW